MLRKYTAPLLPFIAGWVLLLNSDLQMLSLINGLAQLCLFALVVCLPTWKTGRMSYVDIGWPLGVALIGLLMLVFAHGDSTRKLMVSVLYLCVGLRMGLTALWWWRKGHLKRELPRYQYQQRRWQKAGKTNEALAMQAEVLVQGLANASFLAVPALLMATNPSPVISPLEIIGLILWLTFFVVETIADRQKLRFAYAMRDQGRKHQVCNVGLWRYSRHPNYFAEWMVWNSLIIAAIPSWLALYGQEQVVIWLLVGLMLCNVSRLMYVTLVYYTGAVPAEYYSLQKRPDYAAYKESTNMFFPGMPK